MLDQIFKVYSYWSNGKEGLATLWVINGNRGQSSSSLTIMGKTFYESFSLNIKPAFILCIHTNILTWLDDDEKRKEIVEGKEEEKEVARKVQDWKHEAHKTCCVWATSNFIGIFIRRNEYASRRKGCWFLTVLWDRDDIKTAAKRVKNIFRETHFVCEKLLFEPSFHSESIRLMSV